MNINLSGLKQDYSYLFSSMNSNSSKSSSNLLSSINLSDYNSIKSGAYGKLLKAYYKKTDTDTTDATAKKEDKTKTETDLSKELKEIQTDADELKSSAAALMQRGSKSVFATGDTEKIYSAVSDFVDDYNALIEKGEDSTSSSVANGVNGMTRLVRDYEDSLKEIGITINKDNKLEINKDTFTNGDMKKAENLFQGNSSLSYLVSMRAVSIANTAYSESNKSSLYSGNGSYQSISTGDLFSSII